MNSFLEASHIYAVSVSKLTEAPRRGRKTLETPLSKLVLVNSVVNKIKEEISESNIVSRRDEVTTEALGESRLLSAIRQSPPVAMEMDLDYNTDIASVSHRSRPHGSLKDSGFDHVIDMDPVLSEILEDDRQYEVPKPPTLVEEECHFLRKRQCAADKENWSFGRESKRLKKNAIKNIWQCSDSSYTGDTDSVWQMNNGQFRVPSFSDNPGSLFNDYSVWSSGSSWAPSLCAF